MEDSEGLHLTDDPGFFWDVLLAPLDLALIPVSGGTSLAPKIIDTTGDVARGAKALYFIPDVSKGDKV
jgi:hypothetical protein